MKRIFCLFFFATMVLAVNAQYKKTDTSLSKKPPVQIKTPMPVKSETAKPVNSPAVTNTQLKTQVTSQNVNASLQKNTGETAKPQNQTVDNDLYIITGASVTIKTGNDSKEYPSKLAVYLFPIPAPTYANTYALAQLNYTNHMIVGSSTEIGLTPLSKKQIPWPVYYPSGYSGTNKASSPFTSGNKNWMLSDAIRQGFRLLICYHPNIAIDAWEIKQVVVKLKIKKSDGTPHPTLNDKTIVFNINTPVLGVFTGMTLVCEADGDFSPTTNYLTKDILID